jgi:predicted nucleic acid-binding protein
MPKYFADTWYLIALQDRFDGHHLRARRIQEALGPSLLVTHDAVLTEMLSYFCDEGVTARTRAAAVVRKMIAHIEVIASTRDLFLRALDLDEARPDKEYSLVDCMSMVVMRDLGITHVLTNDHHFTQAGFVVVNG